MVMAKRGIVTEDRERLVQPVVREVAIMQTSVTGAGAGGGGLQTKAGGYILTRGGLRIKVK